MWTLIIALIYMPLADAPPSHHPRYTSRDVEMRFETREQCERELARWYFRPRAGDPARDLPEAEGDQNWRVGGALCLSPVGSA